MDDGSDDKDSKRKSRNLSEKKRRDQFNTLVNELNTMVSPGRKMDKSTVLKTTIAVLKKHNEKSITSRVSEIEENWKPAFLTNEEFIYLLLEAIDGFIIIFSTDGQIFYISESVISLLGHTPEKLEKTTIFDIAHEAERTNLQNVLSHPPSQEEPVSFSCYIRREDPNPDITRCSYELVNFIGNFRPERNRIIKDNVYEENPRENHPRLIFMGTGRIQRPQLIRGTATINSTKSEFTSRHSLEWKFLFLDHRAPPIIGYLPFELLGTSGYDYYHVDDLDEVIKCHEVLMQRGEGTSCYYRFLTKGQHWIWLQTRFYITYHQWNSKPEFIVCSHKVVSYLDVMNCNTTKEDESITEDGLSSVPWLSNNNKKSLRNVAVSDCDCTSMSADSPGSRQSAVTQSSIKSGDSYGGMSGSHHHSRIFPPQIETAIQHQHVNQQVIQNTLPQHQILEPKHFVTAISMPSMIASFAAPTVVTLGENMVMSSPAQNRIQTDLQRKHAELQASIEQKQAELRSISEQLVMARLGILPSQPGHQSSPRE
ncbi:hypothetical protein HHI36_020849 [Cryptolaemus montrouzieri]|uniref:Circadian locomoter output cycles protein kaput n=1 Tax=Cryptolaemus montrouzieri TaxID=559131 RepID=A0ABD2NCB8_9CUCU